MDSPYTTTITDEAKKRSIRVEVIDPDTPIYSLVFKGKKIRCCRSLTDRVGAITFHLTQNKYLANSFLKKNGFPVPAQALFDTYEKAAEEGVRKFGVDEDFLVYHLVETEPLNFVYSAVL